MGSAITRNIRIFGSVFFLVAFLFSSAGFRPLSTSAIVTLTVDTNIDSLVNSGCLDTDDNDDCSLRGAIAFANADLPGNNYHIDIPIGIYTLDLSSGNAREDANASGDLDITQSTVTLHGASTLLTVIDGNATDRVIDYLNDGGTLTVTTLTIYNGSLEGGGGAGIQLAPESTLVMSSVRVSSNSNNGTDGNYDQGGGIFAPSANTIIINNSLIQYNTACYGGGLYSYESSVAMFDTTVEENEATCPTGWGGGMLIKSGESATILFSTFNNNTAYKGAGLYSSSNALSVKNCTFGFNDASSGGGMMLANKSWIENVTMRNNTATLFGGGVAVDYSGYYYEHSSMVNTTLAGNTAGSGGGVAVLNGDANGLVMDHLSFAANTATSVGSALFVGNDSPASAANSIMVSADTGYVCFIVTSTSWTSNGYNLTNDDDGECFLNGTGDIITATPYLGTLADNGGPTWTLPLQDGSPAIDHANPVGCSSRDQRGYYRPVDGDAVTGAICDIGTYEYNSFPLNNLAWLPLIKK